MIAVSQVVCALSPWLGDRFLSQHEGIVNSIAIKLNTFVLGRDSFENIAGNIDDMLFFAVRSFTKGKMVLKMGSGQSYRIRMEDFYVMTDDLLYLLFAVLPKTRNHYIALQDYSIKHNSLASLRALYLHFDSFQTEEEKQTLKKVITSCFDKARWRWWLDN
ncbi:MAG: hypothetical protein Q4E07_01135 [Eubacteriales bacterium]|nr:hypothetical protein [Eubacteriales bacterium]